MTDLERLELGLRRVRSNINEQASASLVLDLLIYQITELNKEQVIARKIAGSPE